MSNIVENLELMCDKNSAQDKKLLLLARLVEEKCDALDLNQRELRTSLAENTAKLDQIAELLKTTNAAHQDCPVYKNKANFNGLSFLMMHPKLSMLIIIGIISIITGLIGANLQPFLEFVK